MTRVAIVTNVDAYAGGAAIQALAAEGYAVLAHSRNFSDSRLREQFEDPAQHRYAASEIEIELVVQSAIDRFGRLDAAISNDAVDTMAGSLQSRTAEDYRLLLEQLAVAPFRFANAALDHLVRSQGRLVFVTSGAPLAAPANMALYAGARAATHALMRSLSRELGPAGVAVNAVAPYYLDSDYLPAGMEDPRVRERVREIVPFQRLGRPDELAALLALLVSGRSSFLTGQVIPFSGGGA